MARVACRICFLLALLSSSGAWGQDVRRDEVPAREEPEPPKLTRPPELLEGADPVYPPEAAAQGLEADVTVRIRIDAQGKVTQVDVVSPVGHGFDEAAVEAARQYRFRPAEFDGKPGPIVVETVIHFRVQVEEVEVPVTQDGTGESEPRGNLVLQGQAKERGTRRLLTGVTVALAGTAAEAVTDERGEFRLEGLPPGTYRLVAVLSGFDRFEEEVRLEAGEVTEVTLYLRPKGSSPYETIVEAEREPLEVTRHTVTRRMMTTVPGTFGDPLRVIQNLPGLARSPFLTGLILIRGTNPDDSGVYIDGHQIPLLYHFLGGPSILNPEFLDEINLYPGGFPARFGRALGGIIEVETRSTESDGFHGSADVDLIDAGAYLRAPLSDSVTVAVAGRRSYVDAILPAVLPDPDPGETLVVVPIYWDYQAKVDVDLGRRRHLSFLLFGSDDRLDVLATDRDAESTFDLDTHIGFHRFRARYVMPLLGDLRLSLSQVVGRDDVTFSGGDRSGLEVNQNVAGLRERVYGPLAKNLRLDAGFDLDYRVTEYRLQAPLDPTIRQNPNADLPTELLEARIDAYQLAIYGELAWDVGDVRLIPGLRLETYLLAGEPRLSADPRLVARWRVTAPTTLKAYAGFFHKAPPPEALDATFGNPDLRMERAIHTGLGVEHELLKDVSIDAEVYYARRDHMTSFSSEVEMRPDGTLDPILWKSQAYGDTVGLELLLRHEITRNFYGWLGYTLQRSTIKRRPDEDEVPTFFDSTHNLVAVGSYRFDNGWEVGARFRWVTGRPDTPILGGTYDADSDAYVPHTGEFLSIRRESFHQLDLRAEKTWLFKTWMLAGYLDIINVYNAENPEATQWDYRFRDSAPVRGVPIVPTVGIRGQW